MALTMPMYDLIPTCCNGEIAWTPHLVALPASIALSPYLSGIQN
jgi:hypothetical protein